MKTTKCFQSTGKMTTAFILLMSCILLFACKKGYNAATSSNVYFSGTFSGSAEVPSVSTAATGSVTATYDPSAKTLQYTFTWNNLSGVAVAMHFHDGATGTNGAVVIPISSFPSQVSGSVSGTSSPLNDTLINDLMAGKLYGNIHTQNHPGGEIRAQITKQ
jgi:hypothetical protein